MKPPQSADGLRATLQAIVSGDVPRPIGTVWRADGRPSKLDRCVHDVGLSDDCGNCTSDFAQAALDATLTNTDVQEVVER